MKNKEMKVKAMSMAVAMSMVVGLCPSTIFAATGSQTAKDGTYTKTAHVTRTEDDSDDEWEEYDVEVSLKVEDGKFSEITVKPKEGYDEGNASYFNKAYSKTKGFKTKLEGQAATEDTINSWDTVSGATRTSDAIKKAALEAIQSAPVAGETEVAKETYVLMNIPYSEFYAADQVAGADSVSSATKAKTRSTLVAGSYHVNSDGTDITGITYPVKISDASVLKNYTQITDDSKLSITVNMKGKETTTEYNGKAALFESASYSYYILSETPSYYKEATVNADGSLSFSEVKGATAQKISDASIDFTTDTKYGDYELDVNGLPDTVNTVYGVVISTKEGDNYGLRHLENIWKKTELAWSTGFVTTSHGNTLNSKDYKKMMGQTINKITYYTDNGIYEIDADQYVPVKFNGTIAAENADVESGKVNVTVEGLPSDYQAEYTVEGLEDVQAKDGVLTYKTKGAEIGKYTLKVSDKSGKYADLTTDFELTTEAVPVVFNSESAALVAAEGYAAEDVTSYVKNIESVTVDGTEYAATGKRAVKIIKEDGTIDTTAAPFKDAENGQEFKISVKATGYAKDYEFTYILSQENETITTTELEAAIAKAEALTESDYTAESWASMQMELQEAKDELKNPKTQATVDEAVSHLNAAVEALVKAEGDKTEEDKKDDDKTEEPAAVDTSSLEKVISDAAALKEADYTVDSWKALQSALTDAKSALNAKESQEKVDKATDELNAAIKALVKNGNQAGSQNGSATPTVTKKAGTTTDGSASKGTSGSKAAKTGDPANVLGLLGLAFSSLGAGVGGFAWKRKRK